MIHSSKWHASIIRITFVCQQQITIIPLTHPRTTRETRIRTGKSWAQTLNSLVDQLEFFFFFHMNSNEPDIPPPLPPHGVLSTTDNNNSQIEYRPPVPPHRNVGVSTAPKIPEIIIPPKRYHHHNKHHRNSGHYQNKKPTNANAKDDPVASLAEEQDHPNSNHNSNGNEPPCHNPSFDHQMSSAVPGVDAMKEELHMAEKLVENAALQKKTAFQFDTLTPKITTTCDEEEPPTRDDYVAENKWKPHLRGAKSITGRVRSFWLRGRAIRCLFVFCPPRLLLAKEQSQIRI